MTRSIPIALERAAPEPLYRQVERQIREAIREGTLPPGTRLPGIRTLAAQLEVARITVATAYEDLVAEGYLVGRAGAGTRIADELPDEDLSPRRATAASTIVEFDRREPGTWHAPTGRSSPRDEAPPNHDLRPGPLTLQLFPTKVWGDLLARAWREVSSEGRESADSRGDPLLREAVSHFLGPWRGVRSTSRNVLIFSSVTAAAAAVARAFLPDGGTAALEDPGCPYFTRAIASRGARLVAVPVDDQGLDPSALPDFADLLLVGPAWQYPIGGSMPIERRRQTLLWARRSGAIVLEHDWAGAIRFSGAPLPSLHALDSQQQVVYAGSFLESVPAVSAAFVVAPEGMVDQIVAACPPDNLGPSITEQRALAYFINDGHLERHMRRLRLSLMERQRLLSERLKAQFGSSANVSPQSAGGHLLVELGTEIGARDLVRRSRELGTAVAAVADFAIGASSDRRLVISFASDTEIAIREGILGLARAADPTTGLAARRAST